MDATTRAPRDTTRRTAAERIERIDRAPSRAAGDYPLSRWYVRPAAAATAWALAETAIRPWMVTAAGGAIALAAGVLLVTWPKLAPLSAGLVLLAWFCDRLDGQLARRQGTASPLGAWLDANVDEAVDLGLHTALAAAAAAQSATSLPWGLLIGFLLGKYLLMYGLDSEHCLRQAPADRDAGEPSGNYRLLRALYHLPGNADVRAHLLVVAIATGWWTAELALVCAYYHLRWIVRYALVARRLRGVS